MSAATWVALFKDLRKTTGRYDFPTGSFLAVLEKLPAESAPLPLICSYNIKGRRCSEARKNITWVAIVEGLLKSIAVLVK